MKYDVLKYDLMEAFASAPSSRSELEIETIQHMAEYLHKYRYCREEETVNKFVAKLESHKHTKFDENDYVDVEDILAIKKEYLDRDDSIDMISLDAVKTLLQDVESLMINREQDMSSALECLYEVESRIDKFKEDFKLS